MQRDSRDLVSIPEWGKSPGVRNGNLFQYSCLGNPMDSGTWQATVHGVKKGRTEHDWAPPPTFVHQTSPPLIFSWLLSFFKVPDPFPSLSSLFLSSLALCIHRFCIHQYGGPTIRDLSICRCWYRQRSWNQPHADKPWSSGFFFKN